MEIFFFVARPPPKKWARPPNKWARPPNISGPDLLIFGEISGPDLQKWARPRARPPTFGGRGRVATRAAFYPGPSKVGAKLM